MRIHLVIIQIIDFLKQSLVTFFFYKEVILLVFFIFNHSFH